MGTRARVRDYLQRRLAPIPVPLGKKRPVVKGWEKLRVTPENVDDHFTDDQNTGILNGEPSEGLADVDCDAPEAVALAAEFLPPTECVFGRPSKPRSHFEYRSAEPLKTVQFEVTEPAGDGKTKPTMIVERRSTGTQTIWPDSMHPDGERVRFDQDGEPGVVSAATLRAAVLALAICALLARYWPREPGNRHLLAMAASGYLIRHHIEPATIEKIITVAARYAGDEEWRDRDADVHSTVRAYQEGRPTTGGPTLADLVGQEPVKALQRWLTNSAYSAADFSVWPDLVPLDPRPVPPFPIDALPPVPRDFVLDVGRVCRVPIDLVAVVVLGVGASVVARRVVVAVGATHQEPTNLYVAAVGESGERRSPVLRAALKPLYRRQQNLQEKAVPKIAAATEALRFHEDRLKELRKKAAKEMDPDKWQGLREDAESLARTPPIVPVMPKLIVSDRTPEKLEMDIAEQGGALLLASEEASSLFEIAGGRYSKGSVNLEVFLKAYDGAPLDTGRVSRAAVFCTSPALTIVITPQPIVLRRLRERPEFHELGLLPRFMYAVPRSQVGDRAYDATAAPSGKVRDQYEAMLLRLMDQLLKPEDPDNIPRLHIRGAALGIWTEYHDRVERALREDGALYAIREWGSKQPGRVARITAFLQLVETVGADQPRPDDVAPQIMAAAARIGEYLEAHALAAYDLMGADERIVKARKLVRRLRREGTERFTSRNLFSAVSRAEFPTMEALEPVLTLLVEYGYLRPLEAPPRPPGKRGTNPSPEYEVNPGIPEKPPQNTQNSNADPQDRPEGDGERKGDDDGRRPGSPGGVEDDWESFP
jgi:hypothetical protein